MSGGSASLAAVDDLHQATGRDLNVVVGQKYNATVGGDMHELIQGVRASASAISLRLTSPKHHIGSEEVNIFKVLCDTLELLQIMNTQIAQHVHSQISQPPMNAPVFVANSIAAKKMSLMIEEITLD